MSFRTAGVFKVASSDVAQPLFGSWVTAVSPATGFAQPSGAPLVLTLGTAQNSGNDASQIFTKGEEAWLVDPSNSNAGGLHGESVRIASISGNTVTLGPKTTTVSTGQSYPFTEQPHVAGALGTGSYLIPKQLANSFTVQYESGTGPYLYIGNRQLMTGALYRIYELAAVAANAQPNFYTAPVNSPGNSYDISELYVYGFTAGDLYTVSLNID